MKSCWYLVTSVPPGCTEYWVCQDVELECPESEICSDIVIRGGACDGTYLTAYTCVCEESS